jgi:hypothetical protein
MNRAATSGNYLRVFATIDFPSFAFVMVAEGQPIRLKYVCAGAGIEVENPLGSGLSSCLAKSGAEMVVKFHIHLVGGVWTIRSVSCGCS